MKKYAHIQEEAYHANMQLHEQGLAPFTFGNASAVDRGKAVFAIKPSGIAYELLRPYMMVIMDFDGHVVQGELRPSSDTRTHALLYREWEHIGGIAHTHSRYATAWAQAQMDIPVLGTTHADHTVEDIPCAGPMRDEKIMGHYEHETGWQIIECFDERGLDYRKTQMILVGSHAPFTWGESAAKAVYNSAVLEYIATMASITYQVNPVPQRLKASLIKKHFERKHGPGAYYGQQKS